MAEEASVAGLVCPDPSCGERFHTYHDEHCTTSLVYHLRKDHPDILRGLKAKLGASTDG